MLSVTDANGNSITSPFDIANVNPFRYRGYYYDTETGLYYLQSRYYDPEVGRFVNADALEYCLLSFGSIWHNLFTYCINNPITLTDSNGNIAILDDLTVLAFMGLCAALMLVLAWMSTTQFQKPWVDFCTAVGNGLSWIGTGIVDGGKSAWNWTRKQVKSAIAALTAFSAIAFAHSKIKTKVKQNSKDRYWTATLRLDYVDIGRPISFNEAVKIVSNGKNVFAVTRGEAKAVAKAAYSNKKPKGPEIHGDGALGFYYHYHVHDHIKNGHVYFLFW